MKKIILFLIVFSFLIFPFFAHGGGLIFFEKDGLIELEDSLNYNVFLNQENGIQKMEVSFETNNVENDLIWIFPVPSSPENINVEISPTDIRLSKKEITLKAGEELEKIEKILYYSQIWPFFYFEMFPKELEPVKTIEPLPIEKVQEQELIRISKHLGQQGMETKIIPAKKENLVNYFSEKNITEDLEFISVFKNYFNNDYSFVMSFMEASKEIEKENTILRSVKRSLMIEFPSQEIYYPLSLFQSYQEKIIPVTLNISGYVSPQLFYEIEDDVKTSYHLKERILMDEEHITFMGDLNDIKELTEVRISALSYDLKRDLSFSDKIPFFVFLISSFQKFSLIFLFFIFSFLSFVSGAIAGPIVFKKDRNKKGILKWGGIGLYNLSTIIGLILKVSFQKMKNKIINKIFFIILYTLIFVMLAHFFIDLFFKMN